MLAVKFHDLDKISNLDRKSFISAQQNDRSLQKVGLQAEAISPEDVDDLTRPCFLMPLVRKLGKVRN